MGTKSRRSAAAADHAEKNGDEKPLKRKVKNSKLKSKLTELPCRKTENTEVHDACEVKLFQERKVYNTAFESELTDFSNSEAWKDDGGEVSSPNLDITCMDRKVQQALLQGLIKVEEEEEDEEQNDEDSPGTKKVKNSEHDPEEWCQRKDKERLQLKVAEFNKRKRKLRKLLNPVPLRTEFPQPAWSPPRSPFKLVQEQLYKDPWKLIMACIFLHKTSGTQMKKVLDMFFERFPGPQQVIEAKDEELLPVIQSLGLYNQRIKLIKRFSQDYLHTDWTDVIQLHGVGPYAADAYSIFVQGLWKEIIPDDSMLDKYWDWLHKTQM